jgi:hypothetical protein
LNDSKRRSRNTASDTGFSTDFSKPTRSEVIMRKSHKSILPALLFAFSAVVFGQAVQVIDLKDGGKVTVQKDGTMAHVDAAGNRVMMKDGQIMEAKDGSKLMMKNNAIWKQITEQGTLRPGR